MLPVLLMLLAAHPPTRADQEYPRADHLNGTYLIQAMECTRASGDQASWAELEPEGQLPNELRLGELEARFFFKGVGYDWEWIAGYTARLDGASPEGGRWGVLALGHVSTRQSDSKSRRITIRWSQDPLEPRIRGLPSGLLTQPQDDRVRNKPPLFGLEARYRINSRGDIRIEAPPRIAAPGGARCWLVLKRRDPQR